MEISFAILAIALIAVAITVLTLLSFYLWTKVRAPQARKEPGPKAYNRGRSFLIRLLVVGAITLLMLIPTTLVTGLIRSRQSSSHTAIEEIHSEWGRESTIYGPIIIVPYITHELTSFPLAYGNVPLENSSPSHEEGAKNRDTTLTRKVEVIRYAYFTAESLRVVGNFSTETRARGIYEALLYTGEISFRGNFVRPDLKLIDPKVKTVLWEESRLVVGLNETNSLKGNIILHFGQEEYPFEPGTGQDLVFNGISARVAFTQEESEFSYLVSLTGSSSFSIAPNAQLTNISFHSPWPHPSFMGSSLPVERTVTEAGFSAKWTVPNLVHDYPSQGKLTLLTNSEKNVFAQYTVGVRFFEQLNHYQLVLRTVKYSIIFILLTFLVYLIFENSQKAEEKLSITHLVLIALSLGLFYLLILALCEHISFPLSFFLASILIIFMNSGYILLSLKNLKNAAIMALNLGALYSSLYIIINLEDYALLAGSLLLAVALAALMYSTRNMSKG